MNVSHKQIPPELQEALKVIIAGWCLNLLAVGVILLVPWLCFADKVKDFNVLIVSTIKRLQLDKRKLNIAQLYYFLNAGKYE